MSTPIPTSIVVRVIAVGGKFISDDIGGAAVTIRDADSREILAQGVTKGDSGPNGECGVMCKSQPWGKAVPTTGTTSCFPATLQLSAPRRIEVSAFGPLGARGSANTVSKTTWVYPGRNLNLGAGFLLEMPGLICQVINPPTHKTNLPDDAAVQVVANVAMICGCPISVKKSGAICPCDPQPWGPDDFDVFAIISQGSAEPINFPLTWDSGDGTPGRFVAQQDLPAGGYAMTVAAQQKSTGNTGVDMSTFAVVAATPSS